MMNRIAISGLLLFFATGCFTTNQTPDNGREELTGLSGMSADYIKEIWGEPELNSPNPNGGSIALYKKVKMTLPDMDSGIEEINHICDIQLVFDKEMTVKDWDNKNCSVKK
jgi:hypothetical protein